MSEKDTVIIELQKEIARLEKKLAEFKEKHRVDEILASLSKEEKFQFIERLVTRYPDRFRVEKICETLGGISRSGYYAWRKRGPSARDLENEWLRQEIMRIYKASNNQYGYMKITQILRERGHLVGKNRVYKLMKEMGLKSLSGRNRFLKPLKLKKAQQLSDDQEHTILKRYLRNKNATAEE